MSIDPFSNDHSPASTSSSARGATRVKHQVVREGLVEIIRRGEFKLGHRLPADRELAAQFGVSYMTARRAVNALVEASFLERRIGDGTYVRDGSQQRLSSTTLNLICTTYESATTRAFLQLGGVAAQRRGWCSHVIRIHSDSERDALRAVGNGELSLVLADDDALDGPLGTAIRRAKGRTVLIGGRLDEHGVPSVLADDARAVAMALQHLQRANHQRIALVCNHPKSRNEQVQIAAWSASQNPQELKHLMIAANTPRFECASRFAYEATQRFLQTSRAETVSALLTVSDELAIGALAACRDAGRSVPGTMSLINLNNNSAMEFANPRVTCVDIDLKSHLEAGTEMLGAALNGEAFSAPLCLIEPRLIERESVSLFDSSTIVSSTITSTAG